MEASALPVRERSRYGMLAAVVGVLLTLLFLYSVAETLALFFVAALFSIYLGAVTDWFERRLGITRTPGLLLALLLTGLALVGIGWLIVPPVLQQSEGLVGALPSLVAGWRTYLLELGARYPLVRSALPEAAAIETYSVSILAHLGGYFAGIIPYFFSGVGAVIHLISVAVMAIYLSLRPELYREGFVALFPPAHRGLVRDILRELAVTLRAWIGGQMIAMVILGLLTWIGLMILQVPYALAFGVFTGIAVVVPFFGTLVSTLLPALFVLGPGGVVQALLVVLLGVLVHLFEANFVHPMIMQRQVHLPPVLSILAVLVMAELLGAFGLLIAVPVLATALLVVRRVYVEQILERTLPPLHTGPPVAPAVSSPPGLPATVFAARREYGQTDAPLSST